MNKKKDKQATSSKNRSCQNDSDSDTEALPQVYPGTHWPLDSTLELLINYDAVKEIRAVKPDFYPMLFYLTKSDYSGVAKVLSKLPVIMDHIQTRLDKAKGSVQSSSPPETKSAPPPKSVFPTAIRDLKTAKEEILKLLSNMCLNQNDASELLDWLTSFVTKKKGRTGFHLSEQEKAAEISKPVTRTQARTEEKLSSGSKTILTRGQEKQDGRQISEKKHEDKSVGTVTYNRVRKDASPVENNIRPTREEIYANINQMAVAQTLTQTGRLRKKQTSNCPEDKSSNDGGSKKRGRPKKTLDSDEDNDSTIESGNKNKKAKTKSRPDKSASPKPSKSVSPSLSLPSPNPPVLSPQQIGSPSRFSLSEDARQNASDVIKSILSKTQRSGDIVGEKNMWSEQSLDPIPIPAPPLRNNFGPIPMCLYKVQSETDETPVNNPLEFVTPKIEIDNAEEEEPSGQRFVKIEAGLSSADCSVTASGITQKSTPIIKTICTGAVCGGDNCIYEHSVIVEDCENPDMDCVIETFSKEAKEAEPVIIIDD